MPDGLPAVDPDHLANRIGALLAERRPGAVKPLLAALARLAPEHGSLALLWAGYWCQMQDFSQALAVLSEAICRQPDNAILWLRQAEILFSNASYEVAAQSAAQAVLLAPDFDPAKARLGLALIQLKKFDQALACLTGCFAANPGNAEIALAVAALSPATSIDILNRAVAASPKVTVLQNALARRYLCGENIAQAKQVARAAIGAGIADAQTHCLLGYAEMQAADWDQAAISVARAQSIAPECAWAGRLLAALSSRLSGRLYPAEPEDAGAVEQVLIGGGLIAPGAFRALLEQTKITGPVLDLFCGTGLNAIAAQGLSVGPWTGIDPSPVLIQSCAERGLYAKLLPSDPLQVLGRASHSIILLNEALATTESPQAWLAGVRTCLAAGGIALAAIPAGSGLNGHGLFAHRAADLAQHAAFAGLSLEISRGGVLRHLEGLPVRGVIASFRAV